MNYVWLVFLLSSVAQHVYCAESPEGRAKMPVPLSGPQSSNSYFQLQWENILQSVREEKCYVRPLVGAIAAILKSGRTFVFDKNTGRPLRQVVLEPRQYIYSVESFDNSVVCPDYNNKGALTVVAFDPHNLNANGYQVPTGFDRVDGVASLPEKQLMVVGGMIHGTARIAEFNTRDWQKLREVAAGDNSAFVDNMSTLPGGNGVVGYTNLYDPYTYNTNTGGTQRVPVPRVPGYQSTPIAVKGNNVLSWISHNGDGTLRLFRSGSDLGVRLPVRDDVADLVDEGRGTIALGLGKQLSLMNTRGQISQRFPMGDFEVQDVKYIEEKDGRDMVAVTSADPRTQRLKLSVFALKKIQSRL